MATAIVCQFWLQGQCQRGQSCRFVHSAATTTAAPSKQKLNLVGTQCNFASTIPGVAKAWSQQLPCASKVVLVNDTLCAASEGGRLTFWKTVSLPDGKQQLQPTNEMSLGEPITEVMYDSSSKWLFCGLQSGDVRCFQESSGSEAHLRGHTGPVTSFLIHNSNLISGSMDCTCRVWSLNSSANGFDCRAIVQSPNGSVVSLLAAPTAFMIGTVRGISGVDANTMQVAGGIEVPSNVTCLTSVDDSVLAALADGTIRVFDASGAMKGSLSCSEQATVIKVLRRPDGKHVLLCGHKGGISMYDLPECRFVGKACSRCDAVVNTVVDLPSLPGFATCDSVGEVIVWSWSAVSDM